MEEEKRSPSSPDSENPSLSDREDGVVPRMDPTEPCPEKEDQAPGLRAARQAPTPIDPAPPGPPPLTKPVVVAAAAATGTDTDTATETQVDSPSALVAGGDSTQAPPVDRIPDGGLDAWLQVAGSWVVLVATWGLVNTFGVYQTYYETTLLRTSSSAAISWIGSLQAGLLMLVGVVAGPLYDAGHFRLLLAGGLLLIVLGQFLTSLGTAYWHLLLAQGVCTGIGMGLAFLPSTAILAQWFAARRALAIGLASTGSPLAGIALSAALARLLPAVGFPWATRVIAFVLLGLSALPVAFMRTRQMTTTTGSAGARSRPARGMLVGGGEALRDAAFVCFAAGGFFVFLCLYTAFFYLALYGQQRGIHGGASFAPYTVTLLNVGSAVGRLLLNYVADGAGSSNVLLGCAGGSAALLLGWFGVRDTGGLVAFALLYGAASGGTVAVLPSAVMTMAPDMARVGTRMGMTFLLTGLAVLVGTPAAGWILGDFSEARWRATIGYSAGGVMLATVLFGASRWLLWRRTGRMVA